MDSSLLDIKINPPQQIETKDWQRFNSLRAPTKKGGSVILVIIRFDNSGDLFDKNFLRKRHPLDGIPRKVIRLDRRIKGHKISLEKGRQKR
jgi:hypothetical protein